MKDSRINAFIAGTALVAAVLMAAALSYAIGKWSFGNSGTTYVLKFPNATGITPNAEVKFAGAPCGRVKELRLIAPKDQDQDPKTNLYNCIEVVIDVNKGIEIDNGVEASIKQDGIGIAPRYILLMPGPDHNSGPLADNSVVQGEMPFDLADLLQPAGEALTQAKVLIGELQPALAKVGPMMTRLDKLTDQLQPMLGQTGKLLNHADKLMTDGDSVIGTINTPEGRQRLQDIVASLAVSTENLKVVSYNAKALTATLAQKPWRVFWGGSTAPPVPENQALQADKVIHVKPDVQVNPTDNSAPANH
jgi:ABC-type transporter Mla subunit MlaD